jgi:hypothetical protein
LATCLFFGTFLLSVLLHKVGNFDEQENVKKAIDFLPLEKHASFTIIPKYVEFENVLIFRNVNP